jgi:predicted AAA+ superfamily ATPase
MKSCFNSLSPNNLFFWRDRSGNEIDLILDHGKDQTPIEIKSGSTFQSRFLKMVIRWKEISTSEKPPIIIYGGDDDFTYKDTRVVSWRRISGIQ